MICINYLKDIERTIIGRTGVSINCLAYQCDEMYETAEGLYLSFCEPYKKRLLEHIYKYTCPERSKREDLNNSFFPPPWNICDHPEKTEGWIEFQIEMRKDPEYYLRCGALNTMET